MKGLNVEASGKQGFRSQALRGAGERLCELARRLHPYRLPGEPFRHRDMIDATAGDGVAMVWARADVLEAKAQLKIYLKGALRVADEAEVRVFFHYDVLLRQLSLHADRQLVNHDWKLYWADSALIFLFGAPAYVPAVGIRRIGA
jgi:hypothetical protein